MPTHKALWRTLKPDDALNLGDDVAYVVPVMLKETARALQVERELGTRPKNLVLDTGGKNDG